MTSCDRCSAANPGPGWLLDVLATLGGGEIRVVLCPTCRGLVSDFWEAVSQDQLPLPFQSRVGE